VKNAYAVETRYECLRMLRAPGFAIPFLGLPVLRYLLFAVVLFGAAVRNDPAAGAFLFTGFTVFGVVGPGMFGFGMVLAIEREQGLLRLKRALPSPPAAWLLARMLMAMLFAGLIVLLCARLHRDQHRRVADRRAGRRRDGQVELCAMCRQDLGARRISRRCREDRPRGRPRPNGRVQAGAADPAMPTVLAMTYAPRRSMMARWETSGTTCGFDSAW
jgi:hypothetical protein